MFASLPFILGPIFIIIVIILIVSSYKKFSRMEKNGVTPVYTETPAAQMRRGLWMSLPILVFVIIMAIWGYSHSNSEKQKTAPAPTEIPKITIPN